MNARLRYAVDLLRSSYWFLPGLMIIGSLLLAAVTLGIDERIDIETIRDLGWLADLVYTGGPDGASDVLSVIASSMITVAGVVFSITIVALTLASSQFGPRVLASFIADRGNQLVLGVFIAAFLYSLVVLRTIRGGETPGAEGQVPHVSVSVALVLAIAGLCVLVYFIHHVSVSIQAPNLIAVIGAELDGVVQRFAPLDRGERTQPAPEPARIGPGRGVPAPSTGYAEAMDVDRLVQLAADRDLLIEIDHRPGQFLTRDRPFATVWPADAVDRELLDEIAGMVATGRRRTSIQDVEFPIAQLVEVAVRALSPGINDPFTAITCIDHLGAGLGALAGRAMPASRRADDGGVTRVIIARPVTFDGLVREAFDQIRQNAAHHAAVHIRVLEAIESVLGAVRDPERVDPLMLEADLVLETARDELRSAVDRADVESRHRAVLEAAAAARTR